MVDAFTTTPAPAPVAPPDADAEATLRLGSEGPGVRALQLKLNALGEQLAPTGSFGPRTFEAVRRFQLRSGIQPADGVVGLATQRALARPAQQTLWGATITEIEHHEPTPRAQD